MNGFKKPELSLEDAQIEREAKALDVQKQCLHLAIDALTEFCNQSLRVLESAEQFDQPHRYDNRRAQIASAKYVLISALRVINEQIGQPSFDSLYTSDAISAEIVEEWHKEAVQEVKRISDEIDRRQWLHMKQFGCLERTDLVDVMEIELQEARDWRNRCYESLLSNPKADLMPF